MTSANDSLSLNQLRQLSTLELLTRRTNLQWKVLTIEAHLSDPDMEADRGELWQRHAKTAMAYCRRELSAIKGIIDERDFDADQTRQIKLFNFLEALMYEHRMIEALLDDDTDENWNAVETVVAKVNEVVIS